MASSIDHLRHARQLAFRARAASTTDAATLVRTWPYLTTAAAEVQRLVPRPADDGRHVERIALVGNGLHEANLRHMDWPAPGQADPYLARVVHALRSAAVANDLDPADSPEAERLITEALWTGANTVAGPLRDHVASAGRAIGASRPSTDGERLRIGLARDALGRIVAAENMASSMLRRAPAEAHSSIARSVAEWDVQAHRALLTNRSTVALTLIAVNEAAVQTEFATAVERAGAAGLVDAHTVERLRPALDGLATAWSELSTTTRDLMWGAESVPGHTIAAAESLRRSFADVDLTSMSRDEHHALLTTFDSHLSSSLALAVAARELVQDGSLRAPARAVNAALLERRPDLEHSPVSPLDMVKGRSVPMPSEMKEVLAAATDRVRHEASEAVGRASSLDAIRASVRETGAAPSDQLAPVPEPGFGLTPRPLAPSRRR